MVAGSKLARHAPERRHEGLYDSELSDVDKYDPKKTDALKAEIRKARKSMIPENYVQRVIQFAEQGYTEIKFKDLRHRLGLRCIRDGVGPKLQQLGACHQ